MPALSTTTASRSAAGWKTGPICCSSMAAWGRMGFLDRACRPSCKSVSSLKPSERAGSSPGATTATSPFRSWALTGRWERAKIGKSGRLSCARYKPSDVAGHRPRNTLFSGMSYLDQRMPWFHTEMYAFTYRRTSRYRAPPASIKTRAPKPAGGPLHPRLPALQAGGQEHLRLRNRVRIPVRPISSQTRQPCVEHIRVLSACGGRIYVRAPLDAVHPLQVRLRQRRQ